MNIRLFSLSACLLMSVAQEICANPITLRDKWGRESVCDIEKNKELLGIPGVSIDDTDIYGFAVNTPEGPRLQFINKCTWQKCMEQKANRKNWLESSVLPSGFNAQRVYVYKLKDGVYRLRKTISAASQHRRNVIVPVQSRSFDFYGFNDDTSHNAIDSARESELVRKMLHTLLVFVNQGRHDERAIQFMRDEAAAQSSNDA